MKSRAVIKSVSVPTDDLDDWEAFAEDKNMSFSEFIRTAVKEYIRNDVIILDPNNNGVQ